MKKAILALILAVTAAAAAEAQVKERWRLTWTNEKPEIYTYRNALDQYENYWFFTFTVENDPKLNGEEIVPLILDVMLYTEAGKDLQHDARKVDSASLRDGRDKPAQSEALKFGRFYASVIDPEAENKIIEYHAGLGNRSDGIVLESIESLKKGFEADPPEDLAGRFRKGDRLYLNPREIRAQRVLLPGQKIQGIAIFKDVDPRARFYEVQISGLEDIIKITAVTEDDWRMEYEPKTLKIRYERVGDEYEIEKDVLYKQVHKEWQVRKIGPVASKETLEQLVTALTDTLRKERDWKDQQAKPEEVEERRKQDRIDPLDTRIMATVIQMATGKDFGYDMTRDVVENEPAVWRIHEWWITHRFKLLFNEVTNRFEIKDEPLPGTVLDKQP